MIWTFREPGVIPGVPGQFAGCQVSVNEDGTLDIQPLAQPPHDAPTADNPASASEDTSTSDEALAPETIGE